jgi:CubicO group peptidase (beta-lactamase class C family)
MGRMQSEDTEYGYGWQRGDYEGRQVIHHGGNIPGYTSESLRMPEDRTYVAVLANSDDPPVNIDFLAVTGPPGPNSRSLPAGSGIANRHAAGLMACPGNLQ